MIATSEKKSPSCQALVEERGEDVGAASVGLRETLLQEELRSRFYESVSAEKFLGNHV
jgi:hypothetical protein